MTGRTKRPLDPVNTAVLAWVVPGAGNLVLGRWRKALLYFVLIVSTFVAGWLISDCGNVYFESGRWHVLLQMGAGLVTFIIGLVTSILGLGRHAADPKVTVMRFFEIGTLYTMVAGLLNVLVVMDAVVTSVRLRRRRP